MLSGDAGSKGWLPICCPFFIDKKKKGREAWHMKYIMRIQRLVFRTQQTAKRT